jgi:Uma2 family endonuclease
VASKAVVEKLITAEEFAKMRASDHSELVEGRIVPLPMGNKRHGRVVGNIIGELVPFVKRKKLGRVIADTHFLVRRGPDVLRVPDVAFVSIESDARADEVEGVFYPFAPDLAVEVVSPSNTWDEIETKVHDYLSAGARGVWVANPDCETVHVYEPRSVRILTIKDKIDGGKVLSGFKTPIKAFFQPSSAAARGR